MSHRLRERRSSLSVWSVRLALLSVPVLVIAAIGHRADNLDATLTYATMALGFAIAVLAVIAAVGAFEIIWRDGRKGAGSALAGLILGLVVLSVPAVGGWKIMSYPRLTDISTDTDDPPLFIKTLPFHSPERRIVPFSVEEAALQRDAYPDIVPRHYAVGPPRVFDDARAIVVDDDWTILDEHRPDEADDTGRIEAMATTLVFGFRQDVVLRILPDGEGALLDMRSAAREGAHDLGADAARIRQFFADLDASLQGVTE
jgi:uncharacterized protein (DUF1499 family)